MTPRGTDTKKILRLKLVIYFFASNKNLTIHRKTRLVFSFLFFQIKFGNLVVPSHCETQSYNKRKQGLKVLMRDHA